MSHARVAGVLGAPSRWLTRASRLATAGARSASAHLIGIALAAGLLPGCSLDTPPENPTGVTVQPVSALVSVPGGEFVPRRYLVDGVASDPEWSAIPYSYVAMGPEHGNQGGSFILAMKAAYDTERLYLLFQWPDSRPDRLGPRLIWEPSRPLVSAGCDTLLVSCAWRLVDDDEDRLAVMWDMGDARDGSGAFRERGCQVACHGNMHPLAGSVDIWQWRAARTNPQNFPLIGNFRVGFADDGYADGAGRVDDPGLSFFRDNYRFVPCGDGNEQPVPHRIPDALDANQQPTIRDNDFMRPCEYVYERSSFSFGVCSRQNPCRLFEQNDVLDWVSGDDLSATLLNRPLSGGARESRHDVEARGRWDAVVSPGDIQRKGTWTLELSRRLTVGRSEDIDFSVARQEPYRLAVAIMNDSGRIHSGSPVIELRFQP